MFASTSMMFTPTTNRLFAYTSDVHIDYNNASDAQLRFDDIVPAIAAKAPPFAFLNGDTIDLGTDGLSAGDIAALTASLTAIGKPVKFGLGNHDTGPGDSITDTTPEDIATFYDTLLGELPPGENGYYSFESDGINYLVINSVELQAPTEGNYGMTSTQREWIKAYLDGLQGADKKLIVFSHVDPSSSASIYFRMAANDRQFLQQELRHWSYQSGGRLLAVITGHEHGLENSSANRARTTFNVAYWNFIDGLSTGGESNIKPLNYAAGASKHWWIAEWKPTVNLFAMRGQNGASDLTRTVDFLAMPAPQSFNGTSHYHNTAILPDTTTELLFVGNFRAAGTAAKLMGCTSTSAHRFFIGMLNGKWCIGFNTFQDTGIASDTAVHEFKLNAAGMYIDGVLVHANTGGAALLSGNKPIALCAHNTNVYNSFCDFDLQWAKITKGGIPMYYYPTLSTP